MYKAKLKIFKKGQETSLDIEFGVYSRPSTAERRRAELVKYNPDYVFVLTLENYGTTNETENL